MRFLYNDPRYKDRRRTLRKNQTDAERLLWSKLRNKQLQGIKFFRQYSIGSFILDFYSPSQKLGIELDGSHHKTLEYKNYDQRRTAHLQSLGVQILRFWDNEVLVNISGVLERISAYVTPPNLPLS